ncbi:hypothetical protein DN585_16830 [Intrasporangium calvum]|nr:hypothetical protein DN585_16830 [Intrasporangium calvum]
MAKGEAKHVAETAKQELGNVTSTATDQVRRLMDQSRSELTEQARSQQQRLTTNLRSLTEELDSMAGTGQPGVAHDLVRTVSQQARALGDWLDGNEPGAVLDEVKRFARRKPGTFLAVAAGLGLLSGRMTRGLAATSQDESAPATGASRAASGYPAYGTPSYQAASGTPGAYAGRTEPVMDGPLATTGTTATLPTAPTGATNPTGTAASGTAAHSGTLGAETLDAEDLRADETARGEWIDGGDAR